jgi:hypothetical protein
MEADGRTTVYWSESVFTILQNSLQPNASKRDLLLLEPDLVSIQEHIESLESLVIPYWRCDSERPPNVDAREPWPV